MPNVHYLVQHAKDNVWCEPNQDSQTTIKPYRITPRDGAVKQVEILLGRYSLPTESDWYHVFQIGEFSPEINQLIDCWNHWFSFSWLINKKPLIAEAFLANGTMLPRHDTYFMLTTEGNAVIAVRDVPKVAHLAVEDIYIRFYTNEYYHTLRRTQHDGTACIGDIIKSTDHLTEFSHMVRELQTREGTVLQYVNGVLVYDINGFTAQVGDIVEAVWDSSIREIRRWKVKDLHAYMSTLDNKQKYVVPNMGEIGNVINYHDDNDFYLVKRTGSTAWSGKYYHRVLEDSVRMLTHTDYSTPVQYIESMVTANPGWDIADELELVLYIRESGYDRPLVDEHSRIKDLYRLKPLDRLHAMLGIKSHIVEWQAANLEESCYPLIMRQERHEITPECVLKAYGYNASGVILADSPLKPHKDDPRVVSLPIGLQTSSTIYEYDANGYLLDYHYHDSGMYYVLRDERAKLVEGIVGKGSTSLTTRYNAPSHTLSPYVNYAFFKRPLTAGVPSGVWTMAVKDVDYEIVIDSEGSRRVVWLVNQSEWYTAIKDDVNFLARKHRFPYQDGILRFTVNVDEFRTDGFEYTSKAEIPFGQMDFWLNGKQLIENLDYYVDWPVICIVNKEYVIDGEWQYVTMRGTGFTQPDMTPEQPVEFGYVNHGRLSYNHRFDLRDDKVMRVVVEGAVYDKKDLVFNEDYNGVLPDSIRNGAPYQLQASIIPLRLDCEFHDQYDYRAKSRDLDNRISDFLTEYLPETPPTNPNPIPRVYSVYSPFSSKIIHDLVNGIIHEEEINKPLSDQDIVEFVKQYDWLLKYEPSFKSLNSLYVDIHPHNRVHEYVLSDYQWQFYSRAMHLKLGDKINLSKFLSIG